MFPTDDDEILPSRSWEELVALSRRDGIAFRRRRRAMLATPLVVALAILGATVVRSSDNERGLRTVDQLDNSIPSVGDSEDAPDGRVTGTTRAGRPAGAGAPARETSPPTSPAAPGDRLVAYTGPDGVYVSRLDGSRARLVAADGLDPSWSPDGAHIVFWRSLAGDGQSGQATTDACRNNLNNVQGQTCGGDVWVVSADGSGERRLVKNGRSPDWSPDGKHIAYLSGSPGQFPQVAVVNVDGSGSRIVYGSGRFRPTWSPDGSRLLVTQVTDDSECLDCSGVNTYLRIVDVEGGVAPVDVAPGIGSFQGDWSPDGKRIVFAGFDRSQNNIEIYSVDATGGRLTRLTTDPSTTSAENEDYGPAWSSDGTRIGFIHDPDGASGLNTCAKVATSGPPCGVGGSAPGVIRVIGVDGSQSTTLSQATSVAFSP